MNTKEDLRRTLTRIDGRGYKAYKDIKGVYRFEAFDLFIDHVQVTPLLRLRERGLEFPSIARGFLPLFTARG